MAASYKKNEFFVNDVSIFRSTIQFIPWYCSRLFCLVAFTASLLVSSVCFMCCFIIFFACFLNMCSISPDIYIHIYIRKIYKKYWLYDAFGLRGNDNIIRYCMRYYGSYLDLSFLLFFDWYLSWVSFVLVDLKLNSCHYPSCPNILSRELKLWYGDFVTMYPLFCYLCYFRY